MTIIEWLNELCEYGVPKTGQFRIGVDVETKFIAEIMKVLFNSDNIHKIDFLALSILTETSHIWCSISSR